MLCSRSLYGWMGVTLSDISDCASGYRNPIVVGEVPDWLRIKLKVRVPQVHLSTESLLHIRKKHPDVAEFDMLRVSLVVEHGTFLREIAKPHVIIAVDRCKETDKQFAAVMKIIDRSCEVWLTSFHRVHARHIARWRRKHMVLGRGKRSGAPWA